LQGHNSTKKAQSMIYVGTDIVEVQRIERALSQFGKRFSDIIYTDREWESYANQTLKLAAHFAAKEAVAKALGTGFNYLSIDGVAPTDIEILSEEGGRPTVVFHNLALMRATQMRIHDWDISLSHTNRLAVAFVVAVATFENGA